MLKRKVNCLIRKSTRNYFGEQILLFVSVCQFTKNQVKVLKLENDDEYNLAKPYSEIPGPNKLKVIKEFLPGGKYHNLTATEFHQKIYNEYGVISKFPGVFGKSDIVYTFDPINFEKILRTSGTYPIRQGLGIFKYYRGKVRPEIFKGNSGILLENGKRWADVRTQVNPVMLLPKTVKLYVPSVDSVARDFVRKIRHLRDKNNEMPDNFATEIGSWSIEAMGVIAFDHRLGILFDQNRNPEVKRIIEAIQTLFDLTFKLDIQPSIWKYYKTKPFRQLMVALDDLSNITLKYIDEASERLKEKPKMTGSGSDNELSILQKLLNKDKQLAILMVTDMLTAGIDTTASAVSSLLYFLAKNPDKQNKLREEILGILPEQNSSLTTDSFNNVPYLRGCIKESMRLHSIVPGNQRTTGQDIVLSDFQVPKGVSIGLGSDILQIDPKYFPNPNEFIPERWINNQENKKCPMNTKLTNPFVYMPFGYGVRSCIGKRLAELEIQILLARIVRQFHIEWNYGPLKFTPGLISFPISKLKFKFTDL